MNEALRGSGRTTRLVEQACKAAWSGRAVYLFAHNAQYAEQLKAQVKDAWFKMADHNLGHGIKVESMKHWEEHRLWDWNEMKPSYNSYHPNCLFLVDHFAVEQRLAQIHADIKHLATLAGKLYPHTV